MTRTSVRLVVIILSMLIMLIMAASFGSALGVIAQAPQAPAQAPRPPKSVLGPTPPALGVPAPGPATDKPYAPQPILQGGIVVPVFPPDSPLLKADRLKEPEVYTMGAGGRINS